MSQETLHCKIGDHPWERESKRGKKPANCPEHSATFKAKAGEDDSARRRQEGHARYVSTVRQEKIREIIEHPRASNCRCGLTPLITDEELRRLGAGCTGGGEDIGAPGWVCGVLNQVRTAVYQWN